MNYTLKKFVRNIVGLKQIHAQIITEAEFKKGDKVMDVGCGTGILLEEIHHLYGDKLEYMGIEPDEAKRGVAESIHSHRGVRFKRAFADHLPSVQEYYTHVICMVSFHHFPKETWQTSLEEFKRVLVPGGKLVIVEFGQPSHLVGYALSLINPCTPLAKGVEKFLKIEAHALGYKLRGEYKQFGYVTHLIFTT